MIEKVEPVAYPEYTRHSKAMQHAIVELVLEEGAEPPTDQQNIEQVHALVLRYNLTMLEAIELAMISTDAIGM